MKPLVKVCGLTSLRDAQMCAAAGANLLGFIFYPKSPRYIPPEKAAEIIAELPGQILPVGVFVNESRETLEKIISWTGIRVIQLSGDESPGECRNYQVDVWKAFRLKTPEETESVARYPIAAALIDGVSNGQYGGTGCLADFSLAVMVKHHHPVVLAGGLNPGNIIEAVRNVNPWAVDLNSGVESSPGNKDPDKIAALFEALTLEFPQEKRN